MKMQRFAMEKLVKWKISKFRKPLILEGARQVGKTWLAQEFGRANFSEVIYVSFLESENLKRVFTEGLSLDRLLSALSVESGVVPGDPETLIILDEIQECPRALSSLKMFNEQRPEIPIIVAGSLLGVALHQGVSFPVGKVERLRLNPFTFREFLLALGEANLSKLIDEGDWKLINAFSEKFIDYLRLYYYIGGMPEAILRYAQTKDYAQVRELQKEILRDYEFDFSKYAQPVQSEKIRQLWRSIPSQLAKENKKLIYSAIKRGARGREYEEAIGWLLSSGLILKVNRIEKPGLPLKHYEDESAFKLYFLDVGLLGAASSLNVETILNGNKLFTEFKGALSEQYVCQHLFENLGEEPHYWSAKNSSGEIDFIFEYENKVFPVEVKAETNLRSRSLRAFAEKFQIGQSLRFSLSGAKEQGWMTNIPLYAIETVPHKLWNFLLAT